MQLSANLKTYWLLLKDLSNEEKRSLIELLAQSLKVPATQKGKSERQETTSEDIGRLEEIIKIFFPK